MKAADNKVNFIAIHVLKIKCIDDNLIMSNLTLQYQRYD